MREYVYMLTSLRMRLLSSVVPIGDGITLSVKNKKKWRLIWAKHIYKEEKT